MCTCESRFFSKLFLVMIFTKLIDSLDASTSSSGDDHFRFRRETKENNSIRGANCTNEASQQFIELRLVIDEANRKIEDVHTRYQAIVNIVNLLFQPFNIIVALIDIQQRTSNTANKSNNSNLRELNNTLEIFEKEIQHDISTGKHESLDHVQLVIAHKNGSSLCPPFPFYVSKGKICDSSVGVILDFGENENHTAGYLARLLALSMSTHQGNDKCTNPPKGCMNWKIFENTWEWLESNSCVNQLMAPVTERRGFSCLNNKPIKLIDEPKCRNSHTEGEGECECRLPEQRTNPCCDPEISKRRSEDNVNQKEPRKLRDVLTETHLQVGVLLLLLFFLLIIIAIIIRKRQSRRSQIEWKMECHPYLIRNIDEITLPPPQDAFYNTPIDDANFQRTINTSYAQPVNMLNLRPPAPLLSLLAMKDTESAGHQCQNEYAEYAEPEYAVMNRLTPQK